MILRPIQNLVLHTVLFLAALIAPALPLHADVTLPALVPASPFEAPE